MTESRSDHPVAHRRRDRDPKDRKRTSAPLGPSRIVEIPVGVQVLRIPPEIATEIRRRGKAGLSSLFGTRVWLEPRKGQLFLHLGDLDHDVVDSP
jgi:hypothetical protein